MRVIIILHSLRYCSVCQLLLSNRRHDTEIGMYVYYSVRYLVHLGDHVGHVGLPVTSHDPANLSTINEVSIESADHSATGDGSRVEGVEGEGVRREGGVGRSVSDQALTRKQHHSGEHWLCFKCLL